MNQLHAQEDPDCSFLITKAMCNADGTFTICAENQDQTCPHAWVLQNNNATVFTSSGSKFCTQLSSLPPNNFRLTLACSQNNYCSDNFLIACNPYCFLTDFDYTVNNCELTFTIQNPFNNFYTWSFGDDSPAIRSNASNVKHKYPVYGGTFEVCLTWIEGLELTGGRPESDNPDKVYSTCCYTVVVPDCVECENPSISWQECPVKENDECCIKLFFDSPYESPDYAWSIYRNNALIHTQTTSTKYLDYSFIGKGPYVVCVIFTLGGKTFECCQTILLPPCDCCLSADFEFKIDENSPINFTSCIHKEYIIDPDCKNPGMTKHKWIFSDGYVVWTDADNPVPPKHIFKNFINTTGQVCVTHEIYCDDQLQDAVTKCENFNVGAYLGVAGQVLKMTDVLDNLSPNITVYQFITQYAQDPFVPLIIDGILINDMNTSFVNGFWWMAKSAQINVNSNTSFSLTSTHIRTAARIGYASCCRWNGIKAQHRTSLNWDGTTISDASVMLETVNNATTTGARLNFKNNQFLENVNGIKSVRHRFAFGDFHNNTFTGCRDCSSLCGCSPGTGIFIDMAGITPLAINFPFNGPRNSISAYDLGIEAYNLNLSVKNFNLFYIVHSGITYESSLPRNYNLTLDLLSFDDMITGVVERITGGGTHRLNAIASAPFTSLRMSNVWQGYAMGIVNSRLVGNVHHNEIITNGGIDNFGISVGLVRTADNLFIAHNNRITNLGGTVKTVGISMSSTDNFTQQGILTNNTIFSAGVAGAGIFVNNWRGSTVRNNTITTAPLMSGIELNNGGESLIKCNNVLGSGRGMSYSLSGENDIVSNTCNQTTHSIFFSGNCFGGSGTFIGKNSFLSSSNYSSLYDGGAITGQQHHDQYNNWLPVVNIDKAYHPGSFASVELCQFHAPYNVIQPSVHWPLADPGNLFDAMGSPPPPVSDDCIPGGGGGGDYSIYHKTNSQAAEFYNHLITTEGSFNEMTSAQAASTQQSIFELLIQNPSWRSTYSSLDSFYNAHVNSFIGSSSALHLQFINFVGTLYNQNQSLLPWYNQQDSLTSILHSLDSLFQNETDPIQIASIIAQMNVLVDQIDAINITIENQIAINEAINTVILSNLQSLNNSLSVNLPHEVNEKSLNNVILKLFRHEVLTAADELTVRTIAQTCFADGGRSVFGAIDLCIDLFKEYYSQLDCPLDLGHEEFQVRSNKSESIRIQPNPGQNESIILLPDSYRESKDLSLVLYDQLGNKLNVYIRSMDDLTYKVNLENIQSGVYYLVISDEHGMESSKILVHK